MPCSVAALSFTELEQLWIASGGNAKFARIAASVAMAESGGCPTAQSATNDWGLWQINGGGQSQLNTITNAQTAIRMSGNGQNWAPWCTAWTDCACGTKGGHLDPFGNSCSGRYYRDTANYPGESAAGATGKCAQVVTDLIAGKITIAQASDLWGRHRCPGSVQSSAGGQGGAQLSSSCSSLIDKLLREFLAGHPLADLQAQWSAAGCPGTFDPHSTGPNIHDITGLPGNIAGAPGQVGAAVSSAWRSFSSWGDAFLGVLEYVFNFFKHLPSYLERFGLILAGMLFGLGGLYLIAREAGRS